MDACAMIFHNTIHLIRAAGSSLVQRKLRSFLSILGVVCGVMAVVAMISIGQGAKKETIRQIERLGTRNIYIKSVTLDEGLWGGGRQMPSSGLNYTDLKRVERGCPSVDAIGCLWETKAALLGAAIETTPQVVACSHNYLELQRIGVSFGRFIIHRDRQQKNLVCVLGNTVAHQLGPQGLPGKYLRIDDVLFKIIGILNPLDLPAPKGATVSFRNYNEMVFLPLEAAAGLNSAGPASGGVGPEAYPLSEIVVHITRTRDVAAAAQVIQRIMEVAHHKVQDYELVVPVELLHQANRTQLTFNLIIGALAGISLLVGGIGIMNIMLATVSERRREIGIRRAVGATRQHIRIHFLAESAILTLSGAIIGLACGWGASALIAWLAQWPITLTPWGLVLPLAMALAVGLFFGLYPAHQASKVDPMVALRQL